MSDRTPATDKGTADRVEADDAGYWVRLVTKQALVREGLCMDNCLARGSHDDAAGDEEMVSDGIWSLRKADGISYLTVEVDVRYLRHEGSIEQAEGPMKSQPAAWSIRQLRHLVEAFRVAGCELDVPERFALTDADGMTWRPDKAPDSIRLAYEERMRLEQEASERRHTEMRAVYETRYADLRIRGRETGQRRGGLSGGAEITLRSLTEAIIGVDTQVVRYERPDVVEWAAMHFGMPWIDHGLEISMASQGGEVLTGGIEFDSGGSPVAYHITPSAMRVLEEVRERHASPAPPVSMRLMSGVASVKFPTSARPREPPPRPPTSRAPLGTMITPDDVRRYRRLTTVAPIFRMVTDRFRRLAAG